MKFEAINTKGERVFGIGVTKSDEMQENGRDIGYLFFNNVHWYNGSAFYVSDFDFIYFDTIKILKK